MSGPPDSRAGSAGPSPPTSALVERLDKFRRGDMHDLCDVTEAAIRNGGGFGWLEPPPRDKMERYWRGVLTVPGRTLFVGRLDGVICGSTQLVRPAPNNEAQSFAAGLTTAFVAPYARGHGLARGLIEAVERLAVEEGFTVLNLDVRESQTAAIQLYRAMGFVQWGTNPHYARVEGQVIAGLYFTKILRQPDVSGDEPQS